MVSATARRAWAVRSQDQPSDRKEDVSESVEPNGIIVQGPTPQVTTSRRLVWNSISNMVTLVGNAAINFYLIGFFVGVLGEAKYGVWLLLGGTIFRYGPLLNIGLSSAINRYVPVMLTKQDYEGISRVTSTSLFFFSGTAVVLLAITTVLYVYLDRWFAIGPELVPTARVLVVVVGLGFALAMPFQVGSGVLSGLQRFDAINYVFMATLLLRTVIVMVLLSRGYGLVTLALVFGATELAMRGIQTLWSRLLLRQSLFSPKRIDLRLLKEMLKYGVNTFLYMMGALIIYHASSLVIGIFIGPAQISQFTVASAGVFVLSQLVQALTSVIKPAISDLDARDQTDHVRQLGLLAQKYSLLLLLPSTWFLIVMGRQFLDVWVGSELTPEVLQQMGTVLAILAVGYFALLAQYSNFLVLVGRGQHRIFGLLTVGAAVLCVAGAVVTVKMLHLGLVGIAWANCIPMVLISGVILPIYFYRKMNISARESIVRVWWPALLGSIPGAALVSAWKYIAPPDSRVEIFAVVAAVAAVTLSWSWFASLEPIERRRFVGVLAARSR